MPPPKQGTGVDDARQVAILRRMKFFSGEQRLDVAKLVQNGFDRGHALRLSAMNAGTDRVSSKAPLSFQDAAFAPFEFLGEVLTGPQKVIIGGVAAATQGAGFLDTLKEAAVGPLTTRRTFGEVPGLADNIGVGGVLATDIFADPLFFAGFGLRKTGQVGRALGRLEKARLQLTTGDLVVASGKGAAVPVNRMTEALASRGSVRLKGRTAKQTEKWLSQVEKDYGVFQQAWVGRDLGGLPPAVDSLFGGAGRGSGFNRVPTAADLIDVGAEGMFTVKFPFAPETTRVAPLRGLQTKVAKKIDGSAFGNALGLDRTRRFIHEAESAAKAQRQVASNQAETMLRELKEELESQGVSVRDRATMDQAIHLIESQGVLESGGARTLRRGKGASPSRLAEIHTLLRKTLQDPRSAEGGVIRSVKAGFSKKDVRPIDRLGVLLEENRKVKAAHAAGDMIDEPAITAFKIDPERSAAMDFEKMDRWSKESRLHAYRRHYEATIDPATGKGDVRRAYRELQNQMQGGIRGLVREVYGLKKGDKVLKVADALEETFLRLGFSEIATGTVAGFARGYFPRALSPFAEEAMRKHLGLTKNTSFSKAFDPTVIGDFDTFIDASRARGFVGMTRMEVEDLFRRGKLDEFVGPAPSSDNFARYAEQVGVDQNPGIAFFMDRFSGIRKSNVPGGGLGSVDRAFHRQMAKTDPAAANFFLSDPIAMGAKRWGTGVAKIRAQEYTDGILDALHINKLTQDVGEETADFLRRARNEVASYKNPEGYKAIVSMRRVPSEVKQQLKALGAEFSGDTAIFSHLGGEVADALRSGTRRKQFKLEAYTMTAEQADMLGRSTARFSSPEVLQGFVREMDRVVSFWKTWSLFPRPAYHFRNLVSNSWLMLQAGMNPIEIGMYHIKAARLMARSRGAVQHVGLAGDEILQRGEVTKLAGRDSLQAPIVNHPTLGPLTGEQVQLDIINTGVSDTGFLQAEHTRGVVEALRDAEFKMNNSPLKPKRLFSAGRRGTLMSAGMNAAKQVEGLSRTALYLWSIEKKGMGRSDAAANVFEFLFNYGDLSKMDRQIRSTLIPFWSWMRNNIPLQVKQLIRDPAKTTAPLRAANSLRNQAALSEDLEPEWLSRELGFPIKVSRDAKGRKRVEYGFLGTNLPTKDLVDLGRMFGTVIGVPFQAVASKDALVEFQMKKRARDGLSAMLSNLNPVISAPIEAAANISFFRMKEIRRIPGGLAEVPWLDNMVTTPEVAQLISLTPFLREVGGLFFGNRDFHGEPVPIADRVSRFISGSPRLFREGPEGLFGLGGRTATNPVQQRMRAIKNELSLINSHKLKLRGRVRRGLAQPSDFANFNEMMEILRERVVRAASSSRGTGNLRETER